MAAVPFKKQMRKQFLLAIFISLAISLPITLVPGFFVIQSDLNDELERLEAASYKEVNKHLATGWQPHNVEQVLEHLERMRPAAEFFLLKGPDFAQLEGHRMPTDPQLRSLIEHAETSRQIQVANGFLQGEVYAAIPVLFKADCLGCHRAQVESGKIQVGMLAGTVAFKAPISFMHVSTVSMLLFFILFFTSFVLIALFLSDRFLRRKLLLPLESLSDRIRYLRLDSSEQPVDWQRTPQPVLEIDQIDHNLSEHILTLQTIYNKLDALIVTEHETGLFHRDRFNEVMQYELLRSRRYDRVFSVVLIKLVKARPLRPESIAGLSDEEKKTQEVDSFSHFLKADTRITDMTFRITKNLFVIVAPETDANGARALQKNLAERIQQAEMTMLSGEEEHAEPLYEFDFQIGFATYGDHCSTAKQMMHDAAERMKPLDSEPTP